METNPIKNQTIKISVVIPAHNEEASIAETLKYVLAQDYPDFEVIVVDNASTDKTSIIAKQFPVRVVHEAKKGLLHARDRGFREATGEIIANIDADCLPRKDWLRKGAEHFNYSQVVAVTGPYDYYDGSSFFRKGSLLMQQYIYSSVNQLLQKFEKGAVLIGGNNLIHTSALKRMNGYTTSIIFYGEDTDTAKRVSKFGTVVFNPTFTQKTSARRFKTEGFTRITAKYLFYFCKTILSKKS